MSRPARPLHTAHVECRPFDVVTEPFGLSNQAVVTAIFTDLGIYLGHLLSGFPVDMLRLRVCIVAAAAFLSGSVVGALSFERMHEHSLLVPALLTGACGLCYGVYRQYSSAKKTAIPS